MFIITIKRDSKNPLTPLSSVDLKQSEQKTGLPKSPQLPPYYILYLFLIFFIYNSNKNLSTLQNCCKFFACEIYSDAAAAMGIVDIRYNWFLIKLKKLFLPRQRSPISTVTQSWLVLVVTLLLLVTHTQSLTECHAYFTRLKIILLTHGAESAWKSRRSLGGPCRYFAVSIDSQQQKQSQFFIL